MQLFDLLQLLQSKPDEQEFLSRERNNSDPLRSPRAARIPPRIKVFKNSRLFGIVLFFYKDPHKVLFRIQHYDPVLRVYGQVQSPRAFNER